MIGIGIVGVGIEHVEHLRLGVRVSASRPGQRPGAW
jgi:hypothetical protein